MTGFIEETVLFLHSLGFFTVVLPFILIYVISYGLMLRIKLFQREGSNAYMQYNSVLAFCFAFFTISAVDLTERLPMFIALVSFLFIGLLVISILLGMFGGNDILRQKKTKPFFIGFISLYLLFAIIEIFFDWKVIINFIMKTGVSSLIPVAIFLMIFLGIVYWVTKDSGNSDRNSTDSSKHSSSENKSLPNTSSSPTENTDLPQSVSSHGPFNITKKKSYDDQGNLL